MNVEIELYDDFEINNETLEIAVCISANAHYDPGKIHGPIDSCYPPSSDLDYWITKVVIYPTIGKEIEIDPNTKLTPIEQMFVDLAERYAEDKQDSIFEQALETQSSYNEPDYDPMDRYL